MTTLQGTRLRRTMLNKVPEVTVYFWIIKVLWHDGGREALPTTSTRRWGFGLTNTTVVFSAALWWR